jgi:uncharacterized protein YllA (UPF0747 family)
LKNQLEDFYDQLSINFKAIDTTLEGAVMAELQRAKNGIDQLEKKLHASYKRKSEVGYNQIKSITERVMPEGIPQERSQNMFNYASLNIKNIINEALTNFEIFEDKLNIFVE